jgi:hypothetical protein
MILGFVLGRMQVHRLPMIPVVLKGKWWALLCGRRCGVIQVFDAKRVFSPSTGGQVQRRPVESSVFGTLGQSGSSTMRPQIRLALESTSSPYEVSRSRAGRCA